MANRGPKVRVKLGSFELRLLNEWASLLRRPMTLEEATRELDASVHHLLTPEFMEEYAHNWRAQQASIEASTREHLARQQTRLEECGGDATLAYFHESQELEEALSGCNVTTNHEGDE